MMLDIGRSLYLKIKAMKKQFLEDRLINFSTDIIDVVKSISKTEIGINLSKQLGRSGTSVALNYGEAQSAESRKDFVHKMKVILKELRETYICLRIIDKANLYRKDDTRMADAISENNQLIAIFVKSIATAQGSNGSKRSLEQREQQEHQSGGATGTTRTIE